MEEAILKSGTPCTEWHFQNGQQSRKGRRRGGKRGSKGGLVKVKVKRVFGKQKTCELDLEGSKGGGWITYPNGGAEHHERSLLSK